MAAQESLWHSHAYSNDPPGDGGFGPDLDRSHSRLPFSQKNYR